MTSSNRSLEKGLIAHSVVAIALAALGVFPFGFSPGIVVMGITLSPLQAIGLAPNFSEDDWRPIFMIFFLTVAWPIGLIAGYAIGFVLLRRRSKLIQWLCYLATVIPWPFMMTFIFANSGRTIG